MTTIAYFISSHGYGHAARACAVMEALIDRLPNLHFLIFTQVPEWFFNDSLPAGSFDYIKQFTDVGFVQKSPFQEDVKATLDFLNKTLPFDEAFITKSAQKITRHRCPLVLCDISPVGILSAQKAGLPVVLIENFTWDWMYARYAEFSESFTRHADYLKEIYHTVDMRFQTQPFTHAVKTGIQVPPVSRKPKHTAQEIRLSLEIPDEAPTVLISTGGVPTRHAFTERLKERDDIYFIIPHDVPSAVRSGNVRMLAHHSNFFHPDLVNASDAVVCKAGYSTVAEAYHLNKSLGLVVRPNFPESPIIERFVKAHFQHLILEPTVFQKGDWIDALDVLLTEGNRRKTKRRPNGALTVAAEILERFEHLF